MDNFDRGGRRRHFCMLLLLLTCLAIQHVKSVASEEEYPTLLENQGSKDDLLDARSTLVSSLNRLLEQEEDEKRGSSFYPLRGKKMSNVDPHVADHYQFMSDNGDKRSQFYPLRGKKIPSELKRGSYFMPMRGRKDGESSVDEEDDRGEDKRASSFMPMRGKKNNDGASSSFQHYGKPGTYPSVKTEIKLPSNSEYIRSRIKRMSSFVPTRARNSGRQESSNVTTSEKVENPIKRKLNATYSTHMQYKRSISFTPMRGRRLLSISKERVESSDGDGPGEIATSLLEKKHYSFMPMRGRRTSYYGESNSNLSTNLRDNPIRLTHMPEFQENESQDAGEDLQEANISTGKKASSFMPMRGRKSHFDDQYYQESTFQPSRSYFEDSYAPSVYMEPEYKRVPSFMPMRGRRENEIADYSNNLFDDDLKRSTFFMPMRGRRDDSDLSNATLSDSDELANRLMPISGNNLPIEADQTSERTKRKPFSFMPMRGRRFPIGKEWINEVDSESDDIDKRGYSFMPMRGRRAALESRRSTYYYSPFPYLVPNGIGSALISRPFGGSKELLMNSIRAAEAKNRRIYDWDSVKRAFHATRGKRFRKGDIDDLEEDQSQTKDEYEDNSKPSESQEENFRSKRNNFHHQERLKSQRKYLALKRPMSFFATRGKRMEEGSIDRFSELP